MRWLLASILLLVCTQVQAVTCADIWTQPIRANSTVPSTMPAPASSNPNFPQPLAAIDYHYSTAGNYVIDTNVVRTTSGATTRLFINGNLTINNNVQLNAGGPPQNLIIVVSGSLVLSNNVSINGFILAGGNVQLYNNVLVNGAITSRSSISSFGATVNYRADAIPSLVGGVVCTSSTPSATLLAHYPLDICTSTSSSVIEDLTGKYPASGVNVGAKSLGKVLEAADFSAAAGDYISVPPAALNGLTNFSISMWIYLDPGSSLRELISASSNSVDNELELYVTSSNEVRVGLKGSYYSFTGGSVSPVVNNNVWYQVTLVRNGSELCLYLNNSLVRCITATSSSLSVARAAIGTWWRADGSIADNFIGDIDEVLLYNNPLTLTQIQQMYTNQNAGRSYDGSVRVSQCNQCLSDSFSSTLSGNWMTSRSSGSFSPQVVSGRLRMTEAVNNQATVATYQRTYPAADNLILVEFDYWAYGGTGANGLALVLSDALVTPQAGAFGGPLGYGFSTGIPGFAGGWLGFGLDESGNYSNEGGSTNVGRRRQSVVVRGSGSGNSGYRYLRGTCTNGTTNIDSNCLTPAVDGNSASPHRYRFTIDSRTAGSTLVSVERNSGSGFVTLIAPFNARTETGQAASPANFLLSLTSSTGSATNIHELDNLSICALKSSALASTIDHFEFDYSGQALTCKPETFTVRACKNASCSELFTSDITATLLPSSSANISWVDGNTISFSGGQTSANLRNTVAGSVTVGISDSVPALKPLSQTLCRAGGGALSAAACNVSFASSGLVFSVPDGVAGQPSDNITVAAVRQSDTSQQCVPQFAEVSRNVGFWSSYIDPGPTSRPASLPVQINNITIGGSEAGRTNVPLSFNANGEAQISINYSDAGQVQLNGRYTGSASTNDSGLLMDGADQFIRRPAGLCLQATEQCLAADASCPVFKRAGEAFPLTLSAHAWQQSSTNLCTNPVTPNFQQSTIALSHSLVAPTGDAGSLGLNSYAHQRAINGSTTINQTVSEVGIFRFHTAPVNYLTMTDPIPAATSSAIGRFVPADFAVSAITSTPACGSFSYMQQPFNLGFTVTARNVAGQRTRNYYGAFANASLLLQAENADNGTNLTSRISSSGFGSWELGQQLFSTTELTFNRQATGQADGPFSALTMALNVVDVDGSTIANPDTNVSNSNCSADSSCNAAALLLTDIRYGRMQMANGFGPEYDNLPVNLNAEYWDGSRFISNNADNCSVISTTNLNLTNTMTSAMANVAALSNGKTPFQGLFLMAPNAAGSVSGTYQVPEWLQYDWNGDASYTNSPVAEFMFGRYRGNPRQIYWHERF